MKVEGEGVSLQNVSDCLPGPQDKLIRWLFFIPLALCCKDKKDSRASWIWVGQGHVEKND